MAAPPPEPEVVARAGYSAIGFHANGLELRDLRLGESRALIPGAQYGGTRALSPDGSGLAFSYTVGDSAYFSVIDLTGGTVRNLHAAPAPENYSAAWAPDGRSLAFGFYQPKKSGRVVEMGDGGIRIATDDGIRDSGCQASRAVDAWLPDGRLAVRDQRDWQQRALYIVSAQDCTTISRVDARKMYHVTFSPDGRRMAYILRELGNFNRRTRQYKQDSTLYVADANGGNPVKVELAKNHPRHIVWSPDATQIAYDRQVKGHAGRRQIYIYDIPTGTHTVINDNQSTNESNFQWSPTGINFVYDQRSERSAQKVVRIFGGSRLIAAQSSGALPLTWGWLDDNRLVLTSPSGPTLVFNAGTQKTIALSTGYPLLDIRQQ